MSAAQEEVAPRALSATGAAQTSADVARFLGIPHASIIHVLYRAPDSARYTTFEIPKRAGGTRVINAPKDLLRTMQDKLLPLLQSVYDAHPNAHGFIPERSVVSNARGHTGQRLVLNIDLKDFFPTINFGRVRGLFLAPPFEVGAPAAAVLAQICVHKNGLPQGAPTSPVLSNFIAASLDRRLSRLARENRMRYSRYADDITFSTKEQAFPPTIVGFEPAADGKLEICIGEALADAILQAGFEINDKKVRLQTRHVRQSVTGLVVNETINVTRNRVRRIRAMIHAWEKFGLQSAAREHFAKYRSRPQVAARDDCGRLVRNAVYGELAYLKMVRGAEDSVFLRLCSKLISLDPNPSRFIRQMVFGAADFEIFISHAREDRAEVARPVFEACEKLGLRAFLDEEHIAWGESFTKKINTALGAARTVLTVISSTSVSKEWPLAEINTALAMEIDGHKKVVVLLVGKPDLTKLPLLASKNYLVWTGDAMQVAKKLRDTVKGEPKPVAAPPIPSPGASRLVTAAALPRMVEKPVRRGWLRGLFRRRR